MNRKFLDKVIEKRFQNSSKIFSQKIKYFDWLHRVDGGVEIEYGSNDDPSKSNIFETLNKKNNLESIYFKKSDDWEMEHEYRWLLYNPKFDPIYVPIGAEGVVKAVVLGINFPDNQITQVQMYCKDLNCRLFELSYHHPKYILNELSAKCPCAKHEV